MSFPAKHGGYTLNGPDGIQLSPKELLVLTDLMSGCTVQEAAQRNDVPVTVVGRWIGAKSQGRFKTAYEEMKQLRRETIQAKFEAASEQIADRMVALALDGEIESVGITKIRLAAQESVLDRAGFPRVTKTIVGDQDIDEAIEFELTLLREAEAHDAGSEGPAALEAAFGEFEEDGGGLGAAELDPSAEAA